MNSKGHWIQLSELHRESPGLLDDWHAKITVQCVIQCAAIAVRRRVYEQLGGFLPHLHYVADWEMWQRIASQFPVWFEPSILASYRLHPHSATSLLRLDAADTREVREMIDLTVTYHSPARGRVLARKARSWWAEAAVSTPANCWCKWDSLRLGDRLLRGCACVVTGASSGTFARFLSYCFGSLDRELNVR